jgi:23S rRNA (uridine2552-2'-O)-methyltransferase
MARRRKGLGDRRARHDAAYQRAKDSGFAARAIYKLEELDRRFKLLGAGRRVIDLGCWPGSWLQYAAERVGDEGLVVGIDLREVELALPAWVHTFVADVETLDPSPLVDRWGRFDVLLSDMAPHTTGDRVTDVFRSEALAQRALEIAQLVLRPGGHIAVKVFQGGGFADLITRFKTTFAELKPFHAKSSRSSSTEQYLVGRGMRASTVRS